MLILTRRVNEKIVINNNIVITILSIRGNQIKIGIDAPLDVVINREEIHKKILGQL